MVPPCISTSVLTRQRPIPSPPFDRSERCSAWTNIWKMCGSISGMIPMPVSRTRTTASPPSRPASRRISPPGSVYLMALFSRFQRTCSSLVGSASRRIASSGIDAVNACPRSWSDDPTASIARSDDRGESHHLLAELDLPLGDAGDVHEVVDQPGQVGHLPLGHRPLGLALVGVADRVLQQVQGVPDRGQGVPQLVGQGREELVLPPIALPQGLVEPGVLDGDRRPVGEVLGQPEVARLVPPARLRGHEGERPQDPGPARQGHAQVRPQSPARAGCAGAPRPGPPPPASRR